MSALGQKRTSGGCLGHVRFTPKSGHCRPGPGFAFLKWEGKFLFCSATVSLGAEKVFPRSAFAQQNKRYHSITSSASDSTFPENLIPSVSAILRFSAPGTSRQVGNVRHSVAINGVYSGASIYEHTA